MNDYLFEELFFNFFITYLLDFICYSHCFIKYIELK
jgi:hypothetical protein